MDPALPVLLDTGFFRHVTHRETGTDFWRNVLDSASGPLRPALNSENWVPQRTPLSFLEWIGLAPETLPRPRAFSFRLPMTNDPIGEAWDHFDAHYQSVAEINIDALLQLSREQRNHWVAHASADVWDAALAGITRQHNLEQWVRIALVFDAIHKLDLPPSSASDFYSELVSQGFFNEDPIVRNLSKFRLAKRLWDRACLCLPADKQALLVPAQGAMRIKNHADFLDCDLIHLAVLGYEDEHGSRRPISCVTCDDPGKLKIRLGVYRGLVQYAHKLYSDRAAKHGFSSDCETCFNGDVYCFDSHGTLVSHIDVRQDTCPIGFLGGA